MSGFLDDLLQRDLRSGCLVAIAALMMAIIPGCIGPNENADEHAAVAAIQKLGGKVEFEGEKENQRVTKVYLHSTGVQDADLTLLSKLSKLRNLFLGKTQIGDEGLQHLQNSGELQTLSLNSTRVTDAGLESLTKLTKLKTLNVQETQVTAAGAARLRQALPGTTIAR